MAISKTCDIKDCGKPAISEISSKSTTTTEVKVDVCEIHLLEYKKALRVFLGHEEEDVIKSDS